MEYPSKGFSQDQFEHSWTKAKYQLELEGFQVTDEDKKAVQQVIQDGKSREFLIEQLKR